MRTVLRTNGPGKRELNSCRVPFEPYFYLIAGAEGASIAFSARVFRPRVPPAFSARVLRLLLLAVHSARVDFQAPIDGPHVRGLDSVGSSNGL